MSDWKLKAVGWTIWINLLLWAAAFGCVVHPLPAPYANYPKYLVGAGFLFSAVLQHWAYYRLRRWFGAEYVFRSRQS